VLGAGGNVGRAALQLSRLRGSTVYAVAPSRALDRIRELGAHGAYDAAHDWPGDLRAALKDGVDAALDLVGGDTLRRSTALLRRGGRIVTTLSEVEDIALPSGITIEHLRMRSNTADLNAIASDVDAHRLTVPVARVLRLDEVPAALDGTTGRHDAGKVVARV